VHIITFLYFQIRHGLTYENLKPLTGTTCDPEQFLVPPPKDKYVPFLEREVDPDKLHRYLVAFMTVYYDISTDSNPLSEARRIMDDQLWDSLAYVAPLLCRQVIRDALRKEPLVPIIHPPALVFGDIHGNFNDIFYIYKVITYLLFASKITNSNNLWLSLLNAAFHLQPQV